MNDETVEQLGQCSCGETRFVIRGKPITRAYCHCTICQKFNNAPFGDITFFRGKDVELLDDKQVAFKRYTRFPGVDRGTCRSCGKPAIEFLSLPLTPKVCMIPSDNIQDGDCQMEPAMHLFYDRRASDVRDGLPKYRGFIRSEWGVTRRLMPRLYGF